MAIDTVWTGEKWGISASFSPNGKYLVALAGPWAFGGMGMNVSEGKIAINHDRQIFLHSLETGETTPITRDFNPSVTSAHWHKTDNKIYLQVSEEDYGRLYSYDHNNRKFTRIETGVDMISSVSYAINSHFAVYQGNKANKYS
ncbi:hypothetical protein RZS08_18430, partial [Arthrospira platensis SPKY1]|nr:hypothetical protein [Arthrospira platensis SPKY1]